MAAALPRPVRSSTGVVVYGTESAEGGAFARWRALFPCRPARAAIHPLGEAGALGPRWAGHLSGVRKWHDHLWDVLTFQAWWEAQRSHD